MGGAGVYHFSAFHKELLGALAPNQVAHVSRDGNFVLDQIEMPSSGVKALRIPVEMAGDTQKAPFIVAEYRGGSGYDAAPNSEGEVFRGIQLRLVPERFSGVQSDTVYMGELTDDAPVLEDWHRNVRYTLVRRDDNQATLNICGISPPLQNHL
jgi:hypothetical protein